MTTDEQLAKGLKKEKKGISIVWIAPILSLLIAGGMIYKSYVNAGVEIHIVVDSGDGIKVGKTAIMYKGVKVGVVQDVHIKASEISKLELTAVINKKSAKGVARKGNKFWIVEPVISLTKVSGLGTLVSGVYIGVMPAANNSKELHALPFEDHFIALKNQPLDLFRPGLTIMLNTKEHGDMAVGSPVVYKKQTIGKVESKKLSEDRASVDIFLRIKEKYQDIVHVGSTFYRTSGVEIQAGLNGVDIKVGPLVTIIAGGITLRNNEKALESESCKNKQTFHLYNDYLDSTMSRDRINLSMSASNKLQAGKSKVYYKGALVGLVKDVHYDPVNNRAKISLKVKKDFRPLANEKAYFWLVKPELGFEKVKGLDAVIQGNYINYITTNSKAKIQEDFVLHQDEPQSLGISIKLQSNSIKSIKEGEGIFYRNIKIGRVASYTLNDDKKTFTINTIIKPKYRKLINSTSLFYNNSGIDFKADFDGIKINAGSAETILLGGISVDTLDFKASKSLNKSYHLYDDYEALKIARYLNDEGVYLTLVAKRGGSLKEHSPIFFKQIKVGMVLSSHYDSQLKKVIFKVFISKEYASEVRDNTLFYNASGIHAKVALDGIKIDTESLETIVSGGIAFFTPASLESKKVKKYEKFTLFENEDAALEKFFLVDLYAENAAGLQKGSALKYKQITIGHVQSLELVGEQIKIALGIDAKYKNLIKAKTLFWIEGFQFNLNGVKNVSAAIKGPHIEISSAQGSAEVAEFYPLMIKAPLAHFNEKGLRIIIEASRLGGIHAGTSLSYRQVKIGSVIQHRLKEDGTGVDVEVFIEPCYAHLVRENSLFYNASGIGMNMSLFGAKIKTESLESIITGGIGILTPDKFANESKDGQVFELKDSFTAKQLEWKPKMNSNNPMCQ